MYSSGKLTGRNSDSAEVVGLLVKLFKGVEGPYPKPTANLRFKYLTTLSDLEPAAL